MTDIPNTEYITINKGGVFVGERPATHYHNQEIKWIEYAKTDFANLQKQKPEIKELHIGVFATKGKYAKPGEPSVEFGANVWCRVKFSDDVIGNWVFFSEHTSPAVCAAYCASDCLARSDLKSAILDRASYDVELQKLQKIDLSKFVGKKIVLNGYLVTVQKQK